MAERCVHGMDSRFCAICNRALLPPKPTRASRSSTASPVRKGAAPAAPRRASGSATLEQILTFLNLEQTRATYGAVAEALGVGPRSVSTLLGDRRPEASWIVDITTGVPTGYGADQVHPQLLSNPDIIITGRELLMRLSVRLKRPQ